MGLTNEQLEQLIVDIDRRIGAADYAQGSGVKTPELDSLIANYTEAIESLDTKIVSIGQSINLIKNQILSIYSDNVDTCATFDNSICDGTWAGGISTCLVGYTTEYYDSIISHSWAFSSTSSTPYETGPTTVLSSASNSFGVGVGTFLRVVQDNSSYTAGYRVTLGAGAACVTAKNNINVKDAEINSLRAGIATYIDASNLVRSERSQLLWRKWNTERVKQVSIEEKNRLVGIRTAFTNPEFTNLYLNTP